jgi:hypothetical protein
MISESTAEAMCALCWACVFALAMCCGGCAL